LRRRRGTGGRAGEGQFGADLGEAAAAGRSGRRLRGVGTELPAAGLGVQAGVADRASPWPARGGVRVKVLADRMGSLKGGVVANVVVPTAEYVRFAGHYGFRPDFCEAADPESKGIAENLVGYAKA